MVSQQLGPIPVNSSWAAAPAVGSPPRRPLGFCLVLLAAMVARAEGFERFNDSAPETEALEIWRITNQPSIRHHSNYHDTDPFSPDGRYVLYTISVPSNSRIPTTFAVYDLRDKREVYRHKGVARYPIWAHSRNIVYWTEGAHPKESGDLWQLELPAGVEKLLNRDLPGHAETISHDDRYLYASGPLAGRGPPPWVIWRIEARPDGDRKIVYRHPAFPERYTYFARANPAYPLLTARQSPITTPGEPGWTLNHPQRILLDLDGNLLGAALAEGEGGHACWSGEGRYLVRGDGPLRSREAPFVAPGDWQIMSTARVCDPFPCGATGQWVAGISERNDKIYVTDVHTGYTRLICYPASMAHQPASDERDLSDPYDSDPYGSPDGTKIYFSTNYAMKDYPVSQTRFRVQGKQGGRSPDTLEVVSTAGFPDSGVLSVWTALIKYRGKEPTRFLGCEWGYAGTPIPVAIEPETLIADYAGRCLKLDANEPLSYQAATDVYIAVVRKPDAPLLRTEGDRVILRPGFNHREICAYRLRIDGEQVAEVERTTAVRGLNLDKGGDLTVRAVEWSGLEGADSEAVPVRAGMVLLVDEAGSQVPAPSRPERVLAEDGTLLAERYLSPRGWVCQVVEYRADGTRSKRKLYRSDNVLFSEELYDQHGRRSEEKVYNLEGKVGERTRFEEGTAVEREVLKYGLYPVREKRRADGNWVRVGK